MIKILWSDPRPDQPSEQIGWRVSALIVATLFLNFSFWYIHGNDLWMHYPLLLYGLILAATSILLTGLFFVGPSFACWQAGGGIISAIEHSIGRLPGYCARLCCVWFLVTWIGAVVLLPATGWLRWQEGSQLQSRIVVAVLLAFLFLTGLQSVQTSAGLARFTNKLAAALLIAAVIRVHEGWPAVLAPFPRSEISDGSQVWHGVSLLASYVAPVALLASDYVGPKQTRKQIGMLALMGIALPILGGLFIVGVTNVATHASPYYQPSLDPNIAMALWGQAPANSLPPRMILAAITIFGAVRFGARALAVSLSTPWLGRLLKLALLAGLVALIASISMNPWTSRLQTSLDVSGTCLTVFGAVLAADAVSGTFKRAGPGALIDWVGVFAVIAGLIGAVFGHAWAVGTGIETWFQPWLLPSYTVAFVACLLGRAIAKHVSEREIESRR